MDDYNKIFLIFISFIEKKVLEKLNIYLQSFNQLILMYLKIYLVLKKVIERNSKWKFYKRFTFLFNINNQAIIKSFKNPKNEFIFLSPKLKNKYRKSFIKKLKNSQIKIFKMRKKKKPFKYNMSIYMKIIKKIIIIFEL